ncbi:hypothetical protein Tco_0533688 [Tanacetum coccineum]
MGNCRKSGGTSDWDAMFTQLAKPLRHFDLNSAHYMYIAKIQMVIPAADEDTGPAYDTKPLEKIYVIKGDVDQNTKQHEDKCVLLASLVTNLKLDIDENRKIHKQLKKANTSLTQELRDSKI